MTDKIREKHYYFMLSNPDITEAFKMRPSELKEMDSFEFVRYEMYVEANNELIGLAWGKLFRFGDHTAIDLRSFAIKKEYRGLGMGKAFVGQIQNGLNEIILTADTDVASSFWKKQGFRPAPKSIQVLNQINKFEFLWWADIDINKTFVFKMATEWAKSENKDKVNDWIKQKFGVVSQ